MSAGKSKCMWMNTDAQGHGYMWAWMDGFKRRLVGVNTNNKCMYKCRWVRPRDAASKSAPSHLYPSNVPPGQNILTFGSDSVCKPSCPGQFLSCTYHIIYIKHYQLVAGMYIQTGGSSGHRGTRQAWINSSTYECEHKCVWLSTRRVSTMACGGTCRQQQHGQTRCVLMCCYCIS